MAARAAKGGTGRRPPALRPNELALIAVGAAVFWLALCALVAVGLAAFLFGRGWVWPHGIAGALREIGDLLRGRPGRGLASPDARRLPGGAALWTVFAVVELAALAVAVVVARWATQLLQAAPGRSDLATRAEAAGALGRRQLTRRRVARIRPDTYGRRREEEDA